MITGKCFVVTERQAVLLNQMQLSSAEILSQKLQDFVFFGGGGKMPGITSIKYNSYYPRQINKLLHI